MADENARDRLGGIVPSDSQAIAKSSASLMGRGLRSLSGWDATKVIEIGKKLTSAYDEDQILTIIDETIEEFLHPPKWRMVLTDEKQGDLHCVIAARMDDGYLDDYRIKMVDGLTGYVMENRSSMVIPSVQSNAAILAILQEPEEKQAGSIVAVPVTFVREYPGLIGEHKDFDYWCIGVIELIDCVGPGGFPQADLLLLESLADFVAIAIINERCKSRIYHEHIHDELTGLYNWRHFDSELPIKLQIGSSRFSLVRFVSKDLRDLTDSLSHTHYTQLLAEIGPKIRKFCEKIDREMRSWPRTPRVDLRYEAFHTVPIYEKDVGGEFNLILWSSRSNMAKEDACFVARRFYNFFRETVWLQEQGLNVRLTASIGVATYPEDGRTKGELLQSVDEAVNLVKSSTGDGVAAAKIGILPPL